MTIDLRSDTVTRPSARMLDFILRAPVGDDVFEEDPTVNELEDLAAAMFGYEDALYCSSGTQTNQIAIMAHTKPGDEVICSDLAHIYLYEGGGIAANAGCSVRLIQGDRGRINVARVAQNINADDVHFPVSRLVCVEDTMNKGGGAVYDFDELIRMRSFCTERNIRFHCDGARIFNALAARNQKPDALAGLYDSMSVCLSKGLGAPVGSLLLGKRDFIKEARRIRKRLGGGMRQAGIIAAGGLFALQNNVTRISEDHARAKEIEKLLKQMPWVNNVLPVETNIVIFEVADDLNSQKVLAALRKNEVLCFAFGTDKVRMVTHLDFTDDHLKRLKFCFENMDFNLDESLVAGGNY